MTFKCLRRIGNSIDWIATGDGKRSSIQYSYDTVSGILWRDEFGLTCAQKFDLIKKEYIDSYYDTDEYDEIIMSWDDPVKVKFNIEDGSLFADDIGVLRLDCTPPEVLEEVLKCVN